MIIQYDTRPDATVDEKLRSLIESIQLAFGEVGIRDDKNITSQNTENAAMQAQIRDIYNEVQSYSDAITGIDGRLETLEDTTIPALAGRVTTLEGRTELPAAPTTDGAYKLTVTVTDGVPNYTWEAV